MHEFRSNEMSELYTLDETKDRLKISASTLHRLIAKGVISHYRVGVRIMFSEEHLKEYLRSVERRKAVGLPDWTGGLR